MFLDLLNEELGDNLTAGEEYRYNCPFCGETKHKFYIHGETGLWICFKCSETGNIEQFVMNYYDVNFREALEILETYGYEPDRDMSDYNKAYEPELTPEENLVLYITNKTNYKYGSRDKEILRMPKLPSNVRQLKINFDNPEAFNFFTYLHNRGVERWQIESHDISYITHGVVSTPDGRELSLYNHLLFITKDDNNQPIYWNTRSIDPNPFIKSFNGASGDGEFSKATTVFNLNNAKKSGMIVITEGVFDAMTIGASGVATFGKKVTDYQVDIIAEASNNIVPIYVFLDFDAIKEAMQLVERLQKKTKAQVRLVYNPTDLDANSMGREESHRLITNAVEVTEDFKFNIEMQLNLGGF